MAVTGLRGRQILDDSVVRGDLNTTTAGDAVIRKIIAGTGVSISSTGVDAGTGDVTINATGTANDGALTLAVSGVGLSGSATFTANQAGNTTFTVTSNATSIQSSNTIVARDANGGFTAGAISSFRLTATNTWDANTGAAQIQLNGATGNRIEYTTTGVAAPSFTTRSVGSKIVLYPSVTASSADYAIGIDSSTLWMGLPTTAESFKWYGGTTNIATLTGAGALTLSSTITATQIIRTGGTSTQFLKADGSVDSSTYTTNTGTVTSIALATGTTGTDVNVAGSPVTGAGTITLNIPDASATARGLVTTGTQSFAGAKTFESTITLRNSNPLKLFNTGNTAVIDIYHGTGLIWLESTASRQVSWAWSANTAARAYTLPDASGTIPLTVNGQSANASGAITATANTTNALTFNNAGSGVASGGTFNGSAAVTISYNTIGAMPNPMSALGDIIYGGASGAATRLAAGTAGQALVSAGVAAPAWTTLTLENLPDAWVKRAVKVATTANITLSGTQTIDGIAVVAGDRVLVKDQTTSSQNGIYIVAAGAWTRALDADTASEIAGATVAVDQGTAAGGTSWDTDFKSTDTIGTTNMTWFRLVDTGYTIPVTQGGTGATTLTGVLIGNGTGAVTAVAGTASQLLRRNAGNTAYEFFTPTYLTAEADTLATVTGRGATTTTAIGAPNYYDATGTYNVNLASGGSEGRGLVVGYSGTSYAGIGFNVRHSTTAATYVAPLTDTANYILFNQGFTFYHAAAGTAGRTLSWSTLAIMSANGQFRLNSYTSSTAFTGTPVANISVDASGNLITTGTAVTSVALSLPNIFTVTGSPVTSTGTLTATLASQAANSFFVAPNGSAGTPTFRTIVAADIPTLNQNTSGYATTLISIDDRALAPADLTTARIAAGFGSFANNNTAPYADYLHFRSYTDATGGSDNLLMLRKDGVIGMRVYTQTYGSATAYSTFKDVALVDSGTANFIPKFTSGTNIGNSTLQDSGTLISTSTQFRVGNGTQSPNSQLMINTLNGTAAGLQIFQTSQESWVMQIPASQTYLSFGASGVEKFRMYNSGLFEAFHSVAGASLNRFNFSATNSTAAVTHTTSIAAQTDASGIGRTLLYAASNTTGVTRGQLDIITENGGFFIASLGTNATTSNYSLGIYNVSGTEVIRLNAGGTTFLNGGDVSFGTSGFYYDSTNKRLGIGVASPGQVLDVAAPFAIAKFTSSTTTNSAFFQFVNNTSGSGNFYLGLEGSTSATFGATAYGAVLYTSSGIPIEIFPGTTKRAEFKTTGQFRLNAYTATTSFSGTVVGYLAFDSSGNILTASAPGGSSQWTTSGSSIYYSGGSVIVGGSSATSRFNVQGGILATNGLGIQMSGDLSTGRFGTYDTGSLQAIHSWLDATSYEISAGSTSGWVSGISMTGNNATNNPGTVRIFTVSVERARWNASGDMGLGTTSITNTANYTSLQVNGTTGGIVRFSSGGTNRGYIYGSTAETAINAVTQFNLYVDSTQIITTSTTALDVISTNGIAIGAKAGRRRINYVSGTMQLLNDADGYANVSANTIYAYGTGGQIQILGGTTTSGIFQGATNLLFIGDWNTATKGITINVSTGALRVPAYTATSSFTGTVVGYLAFDSSGNILTTAAPAGGGITFSEVTGTTQTAAINTGYITNNASLVTVTLPGTAALGSVVEIVGKGAGLWRLGQPAGLTIRFGNVSTTAGTGGWLQATHRYDSIRLVCTTANTEWTVVSAQGVIDVN